MDITGQMRTELIELVRTARSIVDTGWPRDPDSPPEIAQMENFLRANLLNTVAGNLFYMAGRAAAGTPDPPDALDSLLELVREPQDRVSEQVGLIREVIGENREFVDMALRLMSVVKDLSAEVRAGRQGEEP